MKKYDIGILTLWNVPNYGTYVQAYALHKVIEKLSGRETVQIAHLDSHHYHFYYDYKQYLRDSGLFSKGFLKSFFVRAISDNARLTSFER